MTARPPAKPCTEAQLDAAEQELTRALTEHAGRDRLQAARDRWRDAVRAWISEVREHAGQPP